MMRTHVLTSMIMAACLFNQFTPFLRKKNIELHRYSGRLFLILFAIMAVPLFLMTWNLKLGWAVNWCEVPLAPLGVYFAVRGYYQIKAGDVEVHRASMIMMSPSFFFFGAVRLMALPFQFAVVYLGKVLGGPLNYPLAELDPPEYLNMMFGSSGILTLWLVYSVAVYNAYIVPADRKMAAKGAKEATVKAKSS